MEKKRKNIKDNKIYRYCVITIALLLSALCIAVGYYVFQRSNNPVLIPDTAPEDTEQYIEAIPNDTGNKPDKSNGGTVSLTYSDSVTIDLNEELASLYFANPGRSNQDIILRIVIEDEVIAQSGLIPSGYQLKKMALLPDPSYWLKEGKYSGKFMIYYYDQKTGKLATVNTEIPINIRVEK